MSDEDKYQKELVLKKINKIKAFKEKVLHIKEEEFKNYSSNKVNIKIIKEKKEKSRNKTNKSHKKKRHKTVTKENISVIEENKNNNNKEKSSKKEINFKKTQLTLNKDNKVERTSRFLNNSDNNNNKNDNNIKSVVIKPIKKIEIDSFLSPKSNNKDSSIEKENGNKIEIDSFRNKGLSISLKNINNKIKEKKEEEEKNNNKNELEIINVEKKNCSTSPDNKKSKINKEKFKPKFIREYKLQYCVYPGNNLKLIDKAMEHRNKDWEKVPTTYSEFCDLVWAPLTLNINFQNCDTKHQYVNHIEFNNEISNKMRLYTNLLHHCEKKNIDMFSIFPFTICLQISHRSFNEQLYSFEKLYNHINDFTPKGNKKFSELFNVNLSKTIGSIQNINIPETFNDGKNLWIIKPVNLNRGRYITVEKNLHNIIKKLEDIQSKKKLYDDKKKGSDIKCEYLIIQKYLEKPLLYQGRKFDIRLWVLFIADKSDDVYVFKQGHLKATCTQYDPNSDDLFVHLTNYSVQKYNENFSKIEIGNEIPFKSFQNELDKNKTGKNFYKDIYPKIIRIVRLTGGAAKKKINLLSRKYCFEIFGYDFILDSNFQPYLLEINTNPGLEISSPLIEELLPRMIDDALKLTIDKEFTKSYKYAEEESIFPVADYSNKENMWEKFTII